VAAEGGVAHHDLADDRDEGEDDDRPGDTEEPFVIDRPVEARSWKSSDSVPPSASQVTSER
jgi:hypothetical protein